MLEELANPSAAPEVLSGSLQKWHNALMLSVEAELQWCDMVLPEHSSQLIVHVLKIMIQDVNGYGGLLSSWNLF